MRFLFLCCAAIFLLADVLPAQDCFYEANDRSKIYFMMGGGNEPVYPRGNGRYKRWMGGVQLNFLGKKYEGCVETGVNGAAVFDNPDSFNFALRFSRSAHDFGKKGRLYFGVVMTDAYSLNALPIIDPLARRPTSSVNAAWLEGAWKVRGKKNSASFFLRYAARGKEPLFWGYYTAPYAKIDVGASVRVYLAERDYLTARQDFFMSGSGGSRIVSRIIFDHQLRRYLEFEARAMVYVNHGFSPVMPGPPSSFFVQGFTRNHWSLQAGFNIPFSVKF